MCFIREVSAVVVAVTEPFNLDAYISAMAESSVATFVTRWCASLLVFCSSALWFTVTTFFHWYTSATNLTREFLLRARMMTIAVILMIVSIFGAVGNRMHMFESWTMVPIFHTCVYAMGPKAR